MKITREQAARNHEQILNAAVELFKVQGFDAVSVAQLMSHAGFTHGGFYGHFASKEQLAAETCERAFTEKVAMWSRDLQAADDRNLQTLADRYLSTRHRDDPSTGCPLPCWSADAARQPAAVRKSFTSGFLALVSLLASKLTGRSQTIKRQKAIAAWTTLVGAIVLSRAVDDEALSREILQAASKSLLHK